MMSLEEALNLIDELMQKVSAQETNILALHEDLDGKEEIISSMEMEIEELRRSLDS